MLALLVDENLNQRILRGLRRAVSGLDYLIAQNIGLGGAIDPDVLARAADARRIVVTHDLRTVPKYAYERIKAGQPMPGVIAIPDTLPIGQAIEELVLIVECAQPADFENRVLYLPLH